MRAYFSYRDSYGGSGVILACNAKAISQKLKRVLTCGCCEIKVPMVCSVTAVVPLRLDVRYMQTISLSYTQYYYFSHIGSTSPQSENFTLVFVF